MTSPDLLRTLARVEHALISAPLHAVDRAIGRVVPAESAVRITFERGIDALDAATDRLFGRSAPAPDGTESATARSTDAPRRPAPQPAAAPPSEPVQPVGPEQPADAHKIDRVADELLEDLEEAPLAGELAETPPDEKHRIAELRAKHLVEEFEAEQRARHERFEQS